MTSGISLQRSCWLGCRSAVVAPADLILSGGKVFTADPAKPWSEAM